VPDIDVTVLPSDEKSAGAGEVGVAAIAPALANAIFAATGKRARRMPFKQDGFTLGSLKPTVGRETRSGPQRS
jgi:isoquinoline 1-oxidoreductase beta subunit